DRDGEPLLVELPEAPVLCGEAVLAGRYAVEPEPAVLVGEGVPGVLRDDDGRAHPRVDAAAHLDEAGLREVDRPRAPGSDSDVEVRLAPEAADVVEDAVRVREGD